MMITPQAVYSHYDDAIYVASLMKKRLADYRRIIAIEARRIRREKFNAALYGGIAIGGFAVETMILALALAGLSFNVFGHTVSGSIFYGVVPMAFAYFHIRTHQEGDIGLKKLFSSWGRIALIIMVIAASGLLGMSFITGALDGLMAMSADGGGWSGDNAGTTLQSESDYAAWSGLIGGLAGIPVILFGIALTFSLLIAMNVVSFFVGKALFALNVVMTTEDRSADLDDLDQVNGRVKEFERLARRDRRAEVNWPDDPDLVFARAYFDYVLDHISRYRAAALLAFKSWDRFNYKRFQGEQGDVELIQEHFSDYDKASAYLDDLRDHARPHNTLKIIEGNPAAPTPPGGPSSKE